MFIIIFFFLPWDFTLELEQSGIIKFNWHELRLNNNVQCKYYIVLSFSLCFASTKFSSLLKLVTLWSKSNESSLNKNKIQLWESIWKIQSGEKLGKGRGDMCPGRQNERRRGRQIKILFFTWYKNIYLFIK